MALLGFGRGSGNYSSFVLTPSAPPSLRSRIVSPIRDVAEPALQVFLNRTANKKPHPFRVEVSYLVEAAGTVLRQ